MDIIIDNYFTVLEKLDDAINTLEDISLENQDPRTMRMLQCLRRKVITVRRAAWPVREVLARMERIISPLIPESSAIYLKDVYDHIVQVMDTAETFREVLSNLFDIYLSGVNNRMNEIMKLLTIIATIILPMSFVASLYGMNFRFMPELSWKLGYPLALGIMFGIAGTMLVYFRKKKWL
jgi:magnesium transporter